MYMAPELAELGIGFLCLSLGASGVYLVNDVLDQAHDKLHQSKKNRPIAAGRVSSSQAVAVSFLLFATANALAFVISIAFVVILWTYMSLAMAYAVWLKKKIAADVVTLALLFLVRIVAGALITSIPVSEWLLVTSFFIFLSIATGKRAIELMAAQSAPASPADNGRGYLLRDLPIIQQVGLASGLSSAVLFGLFIDSVGKSGSYSVPEILWLGLPLWVFWVVRFWILVNRGRVDSDPVVFAARDIVSYAIGLSLIVIVVVAQ
jgi:4-hydroxybenzoate polyprenyltransferase